MLQAQEAVIPPLTEAAWGADPWPAACRGDPRLPVPRFTPLYCPQNDNPVGLVSPGGKARPASNTLCRNEIEKSLVILGGEVKRPALTTRFGTEANRNKMQNIKVTKWALDSHRYAFQSCA